MKRRTIPRNEKGQFICEPKDMEMFTQRVVDELCDKYSDIDLLELELLFHKEISYAMSTRLLREATTK